MLIYELDSARVVLIFVLLVAFLALDVLLDDGLCIFPSRQVEFAVDVFCYVQGIFLDVFEADFVESSFWEALFLLLVGVIELHVVAQDVLLHFFVGDGVELKRFDGAEIEGAGALEDGVWVPDEVHELRVGKELREGFYAACVGWILREVLFHRLIFTSFSKVCLNSCNSLSLIFLNVRNRSHHSCILSGKNQKL